MTTHILGLSALYHDSAAALVSDGRIVAAAQEERFTRKKHDPGFPVQAILDGTANELRVHALKMWRENALRKNPSAWEQGMRFQRWLSEGIFKKQTEIAEATHLDKGSVSLYLSIAELPQFVLDAFGDPRSMRR